MKRNGKRKPASAAEARARFIAAAQNLERGGVGLESISPAKATIAAFGVGVWIGCSPKSVAHASRVIAQVADCLLSRDAVK